MKCKSGYNWSGSICLWLSIRQILSKYDFCTSFPSPLHGERNREPNSKTNQCCRQTKSSRCSDSTCPHGVLIFPECGSSIWTQSIRPGFFHHDANKPPFTLHLQRPPWVDVGETGASLFICPDSDHFQVHLDGTTIWISLRRIRIFFVSGIRSFFFCVQDVLLICGLGDSTLTPSCPQPLSGETRTLDPQRDLPPNLDRRIPRSSTLRSHATLRAPGTGSEKGHRACSHRR